MRHSTHLIYSYIALDILDIMQWADILTPLNFIIYIDLIIKY